MITGRMITSQGDYWRALAERSIMVRNVQHAREQLEVAKANLQRAEAALAKYTKENS